MQRAGLDLRQRVGDLVPQQVDLAGQKIANRRRRAAIGHNRRPEAEHIAHHDGAEVAVGPDAAMRKIRLVAARLDPVHEILRRVAGD